MGVNGSNLKKKAAVRQTGGSACCTNCNWDRQKTNVIGRDVYH